MAAEIEDFTFKNAIHGNRREQDQSAIAEKCGQRLGEVVGVNLLFIIETFVPDRKTTAGNASGKKFPDSFPKNKTPATDELASHSSRRNWCAHKKRN